MGKLNSIKNCCDQCETKVGKEDCCPCKKSIDEYMKFIDKLEGIQEKLQNELARQIRRAEDSEHVLTRIPVSHEDLNCCGCSICERVRSKIVNAGYLPAKY